MEDPIEKAVRYYSDRFRRTCPMATSLDIADLAQEVRIACHSATVPEGANRSAYMMHTAFFRFQHVRRRFLADASHVVPLLEDPADETVEVEHIDVLGFVERLPEGRDKEICRAYFSGVKRIELGRRFRISRERVSQILKKRMAPIFTPPVGTSESDKGGAGDAEEFIRPTKLVGRRKK